MNEGKQSKRLLKPGQVSLRVVCDQDHEHVIIDLPETTEDDARKAEANKWWRIYFGDPALKFHVDLCRACQDTLTVAQTRQVLHNVLRRLEIPQSKWPKIPEAAA